ncbi:MAG: sigma-54-dependent Fis family transcriptional regulator [Chitinophagaceae bacterium]|jgi:DNA-binding NtrC family response regulator|nr:sigma-54-dependent Fis family transcriptional regulator [Chitinophagaceae bacterium]MCA6493760.1 sigma-54-dependent Fis family transcriptional regulator [Chitinophagaceae bacterium]MCA6498758.1 sigma-54-dependent Fis family transcriptional regulator [Chitinophagaceae bacterium]MCA6516531.1 sigma-54-dependent Fis family transcriptional regulator [Chitinophagaceae bacterium]MCE2974321.1 sigma-54 dependent transcriptional regulator [Sediminibacterium sp.]
MDIQTIKNRFGIIGNSPALNHALHTATQVAATDLTVLIVGESGVGKEVFSQIIHSLSARKHNPFIAVNCGAIPEGTIDSELFGHEKGAFTGAVDSRKGYFETVNGGTIFMDEIGEMPLGTQARLLRVLETGEFIRVGSSKVQKTDVRVIAATNRELLDSTRSGKFREDLYYRLSTVPIRVPALRDRKEDINLLFRKFSADFAERYKTTPVQLDEEAKQVLMNHGWQGNVRELKNIAEQISVLSSQQLVTAYELKKYLPDNRGSRLPVLSTTPAGTGAEFSNEREILYKLFFDMKKEVTEIKKMFLEILQNPGMPGQSIQEARERLMGDLSALTEQTLVTPVAVPPTLISTPAVSSQPVLLHDDEIHQHVEVEESLNIMDKEKELILKALKKHKGKRRDASNDLGISERTLYRKLKEYDIEE